MRRAPVFVVVSVVCFGPLAGGCSRGSSPSPQPSASPSAAVAGARGLPVDAAPSPLPDPLPAVIARVNGQAIPLGHAKIIADGLMQGQTPTEPMRARAYRKALEQLVAREVLLQEAMARKVAAPAAMVEREYDQARAVYKDETQWKAFLTQQGLDPQTFKNELRVRHTVNELLRMEAEKVPGTVTAADTRAYYDANPTLFEQGPRVQASHILVKVEPGADPARKAAARAKAEGILKQLRAGGDFAALAKSSDDPGSASRGGDLGPFGKGQMVPPFEAAAFSQAAGAVSDLVETQFGFHIIKTVAHLPAEKAPFAAVEPQLKEHLVRLRRQEAITRFVDSLRAKARVETYL